MTVSLRPRITPLVVRVFAAQRRLASLDSSATTTQPSAEESSRARSTTSCAITLVVVLLDLVAHRPASAWVLRIRTPRNSVEGQPWLTAATCPGWPLPQLNAPPST